MRLINMIAHMKKKNSLPSLYRLQMPLSLHILNLLCTIRLVKETLLPAT
jgi:hypothetical protein